MIIKVIGCGNAFSNINYTPSFLLEENGRTLLIDCGNQIPQALYHHKINLKTIDAIYVSHLHGDHVGGLEAIAFQRYDWQKKPRHFSQGQYAPKLIGNVQLLKDLWEHTLRGGLESMEGFVANLETFFNPIPIEPNVSFKWEGWVADLIQQVHIMSGNVITHSYGLFMKKAGHPSLYFTTDSQYDSPKQIRLYYKEADIIFQDCECIGVDTKKREYISGSGVHANYAELAGYPSANATILSPETKAKMWLTHYQDFVTQGKDSLNQPCDWNLLAKEDGFQGFLKVGQTFNV